MTSPAVTSPTGARLEEAAGAVRHHYDVGNDFYGLWLDRTWSYSCAMPDGPADTLDAAQDRKVDHHLRASRADGARRLLDVGCGWGEVLRRAVGERGVGHAVGLTLSEEQADAVARRADPGVEVRVEDWRVHEPDGPVDAIVSVGAFEHFARPGDTDAERVALYRDFFGRCRGWLTDDGAMSLQTIAYGNMARDEASTFIQDEIFPAADLPTLADITAAADGILEVRSVDNGRLDYAWTCEQWARRLRSRRDEAVALVGPDVVARYERYLRQSALGFRMGKIALHRIVLHPYRGRFAGRAR